MPKKQNRHDVMPARLVVKAMRDSGYRNAAYAIAELVDNAIQAGAMTAEILCEEREQLVRKQRRKRVHRIAVMDDGHGMDAATLRLALQYGNGTRLDDRSGIGRFGMGLPNSSLSQAQRVDVYTWQDGVGSAIHSYLDVREIAGGTLDEVPEPRRETPPSRWIDVSATARHSKSGTLVVWSNLDRCDWKTAHAIFRNSEFTIGRVYRRHLSGGGVRIRMAAFLDDEQSTHFDEDARPNDPMYLMANTSCPTPFEAEPMFDAHGTAAEFVLTTDDGVDAKVTVRYSIAKGAARNKDNSGAMHHGRHAAKNIGVSVMRADRELELQTEWCLGYDPRERWWGIEIDFPPALDELFGVTNNKQSATSLAGFAKISLDELADREGYDSQHELRQAWKEDNDPRILLIDVKANIESNLSAIRRTLKAQTRNYRKGERHKNDPDSAEVVGTKATKRRREEGFDGGSDADETRPAEERKAAIKTDMVEHGIAEDVAEERATHVIDDGKKYEFLARDIDGDEFFSVRPKGGVLIIYLNSSHPAYDRLVTVSEGFENIESIEELKGRLHRSHEALKLLLEAWARYEDEIQNNQQRRQAQQARRNWGTVAYEFFDNDD